MRAAIGAMVTLLAFGATIALGADGSSADKNVNDALHTLLLTANDRSPASVGLAFRRYQAAKALRDGPDTAYAYGIVLLRLNKTREALPFLAQAADKQHISAAQAYITLLLSQKQWTVAIDRIEKSVDWLREDNPNWKSADARDEFAEWIGRALSTGQQVANTVAELERLHEAEQRVRALMPVNHREAYIRGFEAVINESENLANTTASVQTAEQEKQEAAAEAEKAQLRGEQAKTKGDRENLKLTAEEWKKTLDNKLAEFGKSLGLLEKEWNTLDQRRQSLERSILATQQEFQVLMNQYEGLRNNGNNNGNARNGLNQTRLQQIDRELGIRQQQILQYQQDRNRTVTGMNQFYQQALVVLNQRQALVADYERATGQLVQKDESLKKWNDRLVKKEKDAEDNAKAKPGAVQTLEQRQKSVGTYLSTDWEAERQRLLAVTQAD